ncbi:hypothetical protein [Mucilaginibacter sp. UR6-11]|uniref:hypothetical protein n=1 Tax=Mucilaginibacter sp. UR6-11 TaxID=1435644 RepID=UPI001E2DB7F7|nr:hypothetical protein [Mucilaginibacter sp. UR6-11]MCC8427238.1 hypothetical protein [Mucilaginibacter sp. UR6-11]
MLEPYYRINQAVGLNIGILPNGEATLSACEIIIRDNKLDIEKKLVGLKSIEELNKHFPAKTFIALNLFGKSVLQKRIEKVDQVDQGNFTQLLPNANFDDFYIQNFISGTTSFISVIRKADADKWINLIKKQGFTPLILSLGPFSIQTILPQLNVYDNEIIIDGHIIQRGEHSEWVSYRYDPSVSASFPLKIESEPIDEKLIIPYAVAFQTVLAAKFNLVQANVSSLEITFQNIIATKKLQARSILMLLIVFILLLINFFVFSWLNLSNAKLANRVNLSAQSTNDIQGIKDQVKEKEALLKDLGWDSGVNKSALIDQLAALLPTDVSWTELTINPIDQSAVRVQKALQFVDGKIRVVGTAERIIPVNEWIARVKTKKWVKNIQLDSYTYNSELNTGQFIVLIDY